MKNLVRKHILSLSAYQSARDEFEGTADVYLDANENPHDFDYNRYPDPYQKRLKQEIAELKKVDSGRIFLGNGSDEIIDLLIRTFCEPGEDAIMTCKPGFSMYAFSANLNQVRNDEFLLSKTFSLNLDSFLAQLRPDHKLIFLCSPNNPTGNSIPLEVIQKICDVAEGLVIVDEAYVDFSSIGSCINAIQNENLVVLQTFSKSYGSAGIRLGMGFMHPEIVSVLNAVKLPYNVSEITQQHALGLLADYGKIQESVKMIISERQRLYRMLKDLTIVKKIHPSDANFYLVEFSDAASIYSYLMANGVIVRDRSKVVLCENCLRVTVGLPAENDKLISLLKDFQS